MNRVTRILLLSLLPVAAAIGAFQNCSNANFGALASDSDAIAAASTIPPVFQINNNAKYTTSTAVKLQITSAAREMYVTNDPTCLTGGDWEPTATTKDWGLQQDNAAAFVYLKARTRTNLDEADSDCVSAMIIHDNTPPTVFYDQKPAEFTNVVSPQIAFHAPRDPSGIDHFECQFAQAPFAACESNLVYNTSGDGTKSVRVRAIDGAGNVSQPAVATWLLDTVPPRLTTGPAPEALTTATTANLTFTADDGGGSGVAGFACVIDGAAEQACVSPLTLANLSVGAHSASVVAIDKAGNRSASASFGNWTVATSNDLIADFSVTGITGGTDTTIDAYLGNVHQPTVNWTAATTKINPQLNYTVTIYDDQAANVVCAPQSAMALKLAVANCNLVDGKYYVAKVTAADASSHTRDAAPFKFLVDTVAPVITIGNAQVSTDNQTATFTPFSITDPVSGIATATCTHTFGTSIEPVNNCAASTTLTFTNLAPGDHQVTVTATDKAGNSSTITKTFTTQVVSSCPFSTDSTVCDARWVGQLYYDPTGTSGWNTAADYMAKGRNANVILKMDQIFVPTRLFGDGFPLGDGVFAQKTAADGGKILMEYFGLRMHTLLKLRDDEAEGDYQFAIISDDGANLLYAPNADGVLKTLVANDGGHSTKMGCGTFALHLSKTSRVPIQLDYFQGPKNEIAVSLVYRKFPTKSDQVSAAPCGASTPQFYGKMSNVSGPYTNTNYQKALDAGWLPLQKDNYVNDGKAP